MVRHIFLAPVILLSLVSAERLESRKIDAAVQHSMAVWHVPGTAVAIFRGDHGMYAKGYGVCEAGRPGAVTPDTLFAIGSTTKAFTTAAMAMLVDASCFTSTIHLRTRWSHCATSSRTGQASAATTSYGTIPPLSREELLRRVAFIRPSRSFRAVWQYNNIMFLAAGYAVSQAGQTTWENFIQPRIFDPLGMRSANFHIDDAQEAPDHASPHVLESTGKTRVVAWRNIDNIGPVGAINASVNDLARWGRFQLGNGTFEARRLISAKSLAEMHTPQMAIRPEEWGRSWNPETRQMTYGLGWTLHDYRGHYLISHGGAIDGFRANITMVPTRNSESSCCRTSGKRICRKRCDLR
jgi:CubicO group peptidase (beta-lactamase class C family)